MVDTIRPLRLRSSYYCLSNIHIFKIAQMIPLLFLSEISKKWQNFKKNFKFLCRHRDCLVYSAVGNYLPTLKMFCTRCVRATQKTIATHPLIFCFLIVHMYIHATILYFLVHLIVKFIHSEKATKFCEISTNHLSYVLPVK